MNNHFLIGMGREEGEGPDLDIEPKELENNLLERLAQGWVPFSVCLENGSGQNDCSDRLAHPALDPRLVRQIVWQLQYQTQPGMIVAELPDLVPSVPRNICKCCKSENLVSRISTSSPAFSHQPSPNTLKSTHFDTLNRTRIANCQYDKIDGSKLYHPQERRIYFDVWIALSVNWTNWPRDCVMV